MVHYNHAVRELKTLVLVGNPSEEWRRATAMLCHALELLQPVPSSSLARSHLSATHHMFQSMVRISELPNDEHDTLLFEAYIIRTATNCLFQQDIHKHLPFDYVEKLSAMHIGALERRSVKLSPVTCPWISHFGPKLVDLVYKTSWIYAQGLPANLIRGEATEVWESLETMEGTEDYRWHEVQSSDYTNTRQALRWACRALLRPLLPDDDPSYATLDEEALVSFGLQDLGALTEATSDDLTMLWPLIVIGALATNDCQKISFSEMATRIRPAVSIPTVDSVMSFLNKAWEIKDVRLCFHDSELLRAILL
jgi:hypothetical protein